MSQIDFVPTFSLLLGLPIPFGNLGTIIPDLFCHDLPSDPVVSKANNNNHGMFQQVSVLLQRVAAFELNAKQVHRYLSTYTLISGEISKSTFEELDKILQSATAFLSRAKDSVNKYGGLENASTEDLLHLQETLINTEDFFLDYLSRAKVLCQSLWAKFDLNSIFIGILVLFVGSSVVVIALLDRGLQLSFMVLISFAGLCLASAVTSFHFNFFILIPSLIVCGLILGIFVFLWKKATNRREGTGTSLHQTLSIDSVLAWVLCFFQYVSIFSNSFVVNEDKIVGFFIQALMTVKCVQILWKSGLCENRKRNLRQRPSKKDYKKAGYTGLLLRLSFAWMAFKLVNRTAIALRACREEQWYCIPSDFLKPLSTLSENSSVASSRFLLTVVCTGLIPLSVRQWLRYQGNLNGPSFVVLCVKLALPAAFILMCAHWALQIVPQEMNSVFPEVNLWQQIVLPQTVYCLCMVAIVCLLHSPLCIFTVFRGRRHNLSDTVKSLQSSDDGSKIIHALVKEIKQNWDGLNGSKTHVDDGSKKDENTPMVYGLATVYSSALLVLFVAVALPLMMVLGSGMSPSIVLMCVQMFVVLEVHALCQDITLRSSDIIVSGGK